jgi:anti-sigma regulatory factor (Ser/Thr protein kinase)
MATVLSQGESGEVEITLAYSLREILRNVVEHANADDIWYSAQYWPNKRLVELSILDQGRGIKVALSRNPHLSVRSDEEAIRLSLLPGISGVAFDGKVQKRNDEWANSGYGLFMTSQLCTRGGNFMLCSGEVSLLIEGGDETLLQSGFNGTAIRIGLYVPEIGALNQVLAELNKKGTEIAGDLKYPANLTASRSSIGL